MAAERILDVKGLTIQFPGAGGPASAVDKLDFHVDEGETVCIVGESGCGKSLSALSILRLLPSPPAFISQGEIWFEGRDILTLSQREVRDIRGKQISMIFQEPMTSLNPVLTVGDQIVEAITEHEDVSKSKALERACELLDLVQIPEPKRAVSNYPHRLSGGMRQRVMIAMALACGPKLLIADEPTTALDVTIQAEVLDLIDSLKKEFSMSVMLITHDLGVVARMAQRVIVMYAGTKVEEATVGDLFDNPLHHYTRGLLNATPIAEGIGELSRLQEIPGMVPSVAAIPKECPFHPRCSQAFDKCRLERPALVPARNDHYVACFDVERGDRS